MKELRNKIRANILEIVAIATIFGGANLDNAPETKDESSDKANEHKFELKQYTVPLLGHYSPQPQSYNLKE